MSLLALLTACVGTPAVDPESDPKITGATPWIERAERSRDEGDLDAAVLAYDRALELMPWNARLKSHLASTLAERGAQLRAEPGIAGLKAAEIDLRRALELDPENPKITRNLAGVMLEQANRVPAGAKQDALWAEARSLAPDLADQTPRFDLSLERRLDLAFELLERGQTEIGIRRLEAIHSEHPEHAAATRLLAQAHVRQGNEWGDALNFSEAAAQFDQAVRLYAELGNCASDVCDREELHLAHQNRVSAWMRVPDRAQAAAAKREAAVLGLRIR